MMMQAMRMSLACSIDVAHGTSQVMTPVTPVN